LTSTVVPCAFDNRSVVTLTAPLFGNFLSVYWILRILKRCTNFEVFSSTRTKIGKGPHNLKGGVM